jgi:hypothetical protein
LRSGCWQKILERLRELDLAQARHQGEIRFRWRGRFFVRSDDFLRSMAMWIAWRMWGFGQRGCRAAMECSKINHTEWDACPCGVGFPFDENGNGIGVLRAKNPHVVRLEWLFCLVAYNMIGLWRDHVR